MKHWGLYRAALPFVPCRAQVNDSDFSEEQTREIARILKKYRCQGATLCLFDGQGVRHTLAYGLARKSGVPARRDTVYRTASISKFVTALGAMKLAEAGELSLDRDVQDWLPFPLRHPKAPDTPITLRMLLSHTAGMHDGEDYQTGILLEAKLSFLLQGDSYTSHPPQTAWEYSNFGAGIAGVVMEAATGMDFEALMQKTVFAPLGVRATYHPSLAGETLADAWRILPPAKGVNFNAAKRLARPLPEPGPDPEKHYALAHGNLCVSAPELCRLGAAGMVPGFLKESSLEAMRREIIPFGKRASNLSEGIGTFILRDESIAGRPLYGHQGMAYGAVHGLFFDPERERGLALLTSAAGEARRGVLADLNAALLRLFFGKEGKA